MLRIKLSRIGKRGHPFYRIIIAERKSKRDGKFIDLIGTYNPVSTPKEIKIDIPRYQDWLQKGAQPTLTVAGLFKKINQTVK